jgi:LDH2 family malate/lactate/ureidoglycolate dehydrogenase
MTTGTVANDEIAYPRIDEARAVAAHILAGAGTPGPAADSIARSLVLADQLGHASHGLVRVLEYEQAAVSGRVDAAETPQVVSRSGSTAVVDGRWGWGQLAARLAAETAAEIAEASGVAIVAVRNCNHSGRLGEWVEYLAEHELVGVGFLSCGPAVAPMGSSERVLGTNPLAVAIPTSDRPVVLDFATAGVAEGKVRIAARTGHSVPPGMLQTEDGRPSTDPNSFYAGGSILPFGLHKGYALSVVIQLLGEALTGGGRPGDERTVLSNGLVLLAWAPGRLQPWPEFTALIDECRSRITGSRPVDPASPVLLPGDVEARHAGEQPTDRVGVDAQLWSELVRMEQSVFGQRTGSVSAETSGEGIQT